MTAQRTGIRPLSVMAIRRGFVIVTCLLPACPPIRDRAGRPGVQRQSLFRKRPFREVNWPR
jgi:hypothetical protein